MSSLAAGTLTHRRPGDCPSGGRAAGSGWTRAASLAVGGRLLLGEALMLRKMVSSLAFLAATAGLVWAGWPGAAANSATLINRVDVIAAVVMLAALPWLGRSTPGIPGMPGSRAPGQASSFS